jgi:hypothetical protein
MMYMMVIYVAGQHQQRRTRTRYGRINTMIRFSDRRENRCDPLSSPAPTPKALIPVGIPNKLIHIRLNSSPANSPL